MDQVDPDFAKLMAMLSPNVLPLGFRGCNNSDDLYACSKLPIDVLTAINLLKPEMMAREALRGALAATIATPTTYFSTIPYETSQIILQMVPTLRKSPKSPQQINAEYENMLDQYGRKDSKGKYVNYDSPVLDLVKIQQDFPQCRHLPSGSVVLIKKIGTSIIFIDYNENQIHYLGNNKIIITLSGQFCQYAVVSDFANTIKIPKSTDESFSPINLRKHLYEQILPCGLVYLTGNRAMNKHDLILDPTDPGEFNQLVHRSVRIHTIPEITKHTQMLRNNSLLDDSTEQDAHIFSESSCWFLRVKLK